MLGWEDVVRVCKEGKKRVRKGADGASFLQCAQLLLELRESSVTSLVPTLFGLGCA